MNWFIDTRRFVSTRPDQIGPGRLVLVVGPSGAGKDTLIAGARLACEGDPTVVFPRRVITRGATAAEDHDTMSEQEFSRAASSGAFALWWDAHGLCYGIPGTIDADLVAGKTVVCNISRAAVEAARQRYAFATIVHVTAPQHVLESRLACRDRQSDGAIAQRLARANAVGHDMQADVTIHNVGRLAAGIRRLLNVIRHDGVVILS